MQIDIAVPAYNEEEVIAHAVTTIRTSLLKDGYDVNIMVSNNGSTDDTARTARDAGAEVLEVPTKGKGAAVRYAAERSESPLFGFIDADLSAHPDSVDLLIKRMLEDNADIVIGSRLMNKDLVHRSYVRTLSSKVFNRLRTYILGISVEDTQCGLKIMNERGKAALIAGKETGWFFDIEFLARAERNGLCIVEVPVNWEEFRIPSRNSKLHLVRDGIAAISAMIRIRKSLI